MPSSSVVGDISSIQEEYECVPYPKSISNVWTSKAGLVKGLLSICLLPFARQVGWVVIDITVSTVSLSIWLESSLHVLVAFKEE